MTQKYEAVAKASGAIMIPQSGLDSVPSDICTWQLATTLREELNVKTKDVVISSHKLKIIPSGGTISTVLSAFGVFSVDELRKGYEPYSQSPIPRNPSLKDPYSGITKALFGCFSVPDLGLLTSSPLGRTDATQVGRSWGLLKTIPSRKDQFYGDNFTWTPGMKARNWLAGVAIHWLQVSTLALLFLLPPLRTLAARFVTQPGEGASKEEAAKCETEYRGTATADSNTKKKAYIRAWYDGDGYTLTAIFLTQAALTVLEDDLELGGGVFTPACLGQSFVDRTEAQGFKTETQIMDH
ncbi:hypothetical protein VHEMI05202 [[Torrubiella] hemipterigena]|nr:hypothetical protein VHEMI05202 [[Torrubiella] hemipterigena]